MDAIYNDRDVVFAQNMLIIYSMAIFYDTQDQVIFVSMQEYFNILINRGSARNDFDVFLEDTLFFVFIVIALIVITTYLSIKKLRRLRKETKKQNCEEFITEEDSMTIAEEMIKTNRQTGYFEEVNNIRRRMEMDTRMSRFS